MTESREDDMILKLLRERGESYGLDLVAASGGRLAKGAIYLRLHQLEERGLIVSREESDLALHGRRPRRLYALRCDAQPQA
jgi:DNA-binding PadR family transcriptional regulator